MQDIQIGSVVRMARIRRRWRQQDLADEAHVSRATVGRVELGRLDELTLGTLRVVCASLEIRVELLPRGRGGDFDRMLTARHSALHESVAQVLAREFPTWVTAPEVSFSIWGSAA